MKTFKNLIYLFLITVIVSILLTLTVRGLKITNDIVYLLISPMIFVLSGIGYLKYTNNKNKICIRFDMDILKSFLIYLIAFSINLMITNILILIFPEIKTNSATNVLAAKTLNKLYVFISFGIISPIIEEFYYRFILKEAIEDNRIYYIMNFIIFGISHILSSQVLAVNIRMFVATGIFGMILAISYIKTDRNFIVPVMVHILNNCISLYYLL